MSRQQNNPFPDLDLPNILKPNQDTKGTIQKQEGFEPLPGQGVITGTGDLPSLPKP